jgi:predicted amidophosphoribosyltransferase
MVQRCIRCNKIILNYNLYCQKCEEEIKNKHEKKEDFEKKIKNSDFFEKQKIDF